MALINRTLAQELVRVFYLKFNSMFKDKIEKAEQDEMFGAIYELNNKIKTQWKKQNFFKIDTELVEGLLEMFIEDSKQEHIRTQKLKTKESRSKPLTKLPKQRGKPRKYDIPLEMMDVGHHILVEMPKTKIANDHKTIRNFVLRYTHKNPSKKFTVRQLDEGVGIWRTK